MLDDADLGALTKGLRYTSFVNNGQVGAGRTISASFETV